MLATVALTLAVLWQFDRTYTPAPDAFLIIATQGGVASQQYRVLPSEPGACTRLGEGLDADFCAVLACPIPGSVVAYWVQAVWPEQMSAPSAIATCWFPPGEASCACHDPATAVPPSPLPPPPPRLEPPVGWMPTRQTTPPPLPQRTAAGLNLRPIGTLPQLPTLPTLPASGGG